jgi:epoxyqueuosine reductase
MKLESITKTILERTKQNGWQGKIVSIEHVQDLEKEIEAHYQNGLLDKELYAGYLKGFRLEKKRLPEKLLAVRSGLARYGKNNITYVPGMGSFHRPAVFVSDMPCDKDSWGELKRLKACAECTACVDACPTGAIVSHRFLVHAERCITFHNERSYEFPEWLDPAWHNSLVGCMICQNVCPMDQKFLNWQEDGATFSEEETAFFLNGVPQEKMPDKTIAKLQKLSMMEYANVFGRNLQAVLENQ